ncbi:hypothetical protein [Agrobacterium tumefaciens]|uniref:hypothetical protein n=1 Tax=Agrobacterium tumefaciens TaxID=358 RepID=UPI000EF334F4|nr:hypothetical protein At1D1460_43680 [Agrobacterium tumefaciens]
MTVFTSDFIASSSTQTSLNTNKTGGYCRPSFILVAIFVRKRPDELPSDFHVNRSPVQERQNPRYTLIRQTRQRCRNTHSSDNLFPLTNGDGNCSHSFFGFANCTAVTETCDGSELSIERFDHVDGVGSLLVGLTEPGLKGDPQRPLELQACGERPVSGFC